MKGIGFVIGLGVALVVCSVMATTVPRSALVRSVETGKGVAEALLRAGGSAVERVGEVAKDGGGGVAQATQGRVLSGRPRVVDGDSLEFDGERIRLFGIDAPESAQTCRASGSRWRCGALIGSGAS